jgi:hypothetical protein
MGHSTHDKNRLHSLMKLMIPICQRVEREHPRTGRGRPPNIPDWVMMVLIAVAILKHRQNKSAQYRYLKQHEAELLSSLKTDWFPSRSTYFDRYRRMHRLYKIAVRLQGEQLIKEEIADARCVAIDKSLVRAQGPDWPKRLRDKGQKLRGVDGDSTWGYSKHHGWVQGYSYEVAVSAGKQGVVVPLLASVDQAHYSEHRSFPEKIPHLPNTMKYLVLDSGYDANDHAEAIEWDPSGRRTGRRFLCPQIYRRGEHRRSARALPDRHLPRREPRRRRQARARYFQTPLGRRTYARRSISSEPFNEWFKSTFGLSNHVWHRGLDNNRTQILGAIFVYQLLVRYNYRHGHKDGQVRWILDGL